jgi:hypothetical protein
LGEALAHCVMDRQRRRLHGRARRITIDLDPTDDPTHGAQQLSFFNRHYDTFRWNSLDGSGRVPKLLHKEASGKKMNAGLEGQTYVVEVAPQVVIEPPDCLEPWRIQERFRHADKVFIRFHLNLGRAYFATVSQYSEAQLYEDGLPSQVLARRFRVSDHRSCCHELASKK